MIKDFNVSERGHGSYWLLGILRWVMVLIFISFGIQKFTPESAHGIALYMSSFFVFVSCCFWHHCQRKSSRFGRIDVSMLAQRLSDNRLPVHLFISIISS
jgi:hypothetical protein